MRRLSSATRRLGGILGIALVSTLPATATAGAAPSEISALGVTVSVPPRGQGIVVSALTIDGAELDLVAETDADGTTRIVDGAPVMASLAADASVAALVGSPGPCRDGKYSLLPYRWTTTLAWWFDADSTPPEISPADTESHLKAAVRSITAARNTCGLPDRVSARASYRGRTSTHAKVRSDASCPLEGDGKNVVGFGSLPMLVAAVTCTRYTLPSSGVGRAFEMDMLLDKHFLIWSTSPSRCSTVNGTVEIVRSVATHEFGHAFGLGHVSEEFHGNLTMSKSIGPCDDSPFTLGLGDVRGLEKRY